MDHNIQSSVSEQLEELLKVVLTACQRGSQSNQASIPECNLCKTTSQAIKI